ncbi:glutathione synthetase-like [Diadema setosum]|uniref:glutathione synthetase-like n=1 Tax=Diadema setosum TaxID=31175 RepID=UPI003B3B59CC
MTNSILGTVVDFPLEAEVLSDFVDQARDFACAHGIVYKSKQEGLFHPIPFTLFPSPLPKEFFEKAKSVQNGINLVMFRVSQDRDFLTKTLARTIQVDDFTGRLFQIYKQVYEENCTKDVELGLFRTDYLLDTARGGPGNMELSMVEINTMAASLGGMATNMQLLHRFTLGLYGKQYDASCLPGNESLQGFAQGMVKAVQLYGQPEAVIVFIVQADENNIIDQRQLEYAVRECDPRVKVIRRTLTDMGQRAELREDRRLFIDGMEVAVIYYRSGYVPTHFPSDTEWRAKLIGEQSRAAVCPSVSFHLAGTKKIQQELAKPGVLERFLEDEALANLIRTTFAEQCSLDQTPEGEEAAKRGIENPMKFVMKPQREGGGNNIYDDDVRTTLQKLAGSQERAAYILMARIMPPIHENYFLRNGVKTVLSNVVSELGIFGTLVSHGGEVVMNETSGHLLRTKDIGQNEGGVGAGASHVDSPFLV